MKKILVLTVSIVLVFCSVVPAFAVYYDDTFPSDETGLTGGLFMECSTNIGDIVIVLPYNFKDLHSLQRVMSLMLLQRLFLVLCF